MGISREAYFKPQQLQRKFKHAYRFEVQGNYNLANAKNFKQALTNYIKDSQIIPIRGTHRKTQSVLHFYHPETKINVMLDLEHNFISGWKLGEGQALDLLKTGNVQ
ncbi:MAG: hypothetical protein H7A32_00510 [Deltaproteobacteria bacterium]|nr:hypothetical protein [Deltaproteobacteria bacterium]